MQTFRVRGTSAAMALILAGCAVYDPQSAFQRAFREHALGTTAAAPGDVTVQWFGVSTLLFRQGSEAILIDGFFSRPNAWRTAFGRLGPEPSAVSAVLNTAYAGPIAAVFVAHAHHDHAQDAPALARDSKRSTVLYGSSSVLNLARGYGVQEERLRLIRSSIPSEIAGFQVLAIQTPHARSRFPAAEIEEVRPLPAHALSYSAGPNYSFFVRRDDVRVLVVPSAGHEVIADGDIFGEERADIVFLGIGSLGKQDADFVDGFWNASVGRRHAKLVVLIHWDAFTHGLDEPLRPFSPPFDDVGTAYRHLCRLARLDGTALRFITPVAPVNLSELATTPPPWTPCECGSTDTPICDQGQLRAKLFFPDVLNS